jgi:hypothetical protein
MRLAVAAVRQLASGPVIFDSCSWQLAILTPLTSLREFTASARLDASHPQPELFPPHQQHAVSKGRVTCQALHKCISIARCTAHMHANARTFVTDCHTDTASSSSAHDLQKQLRMLMKKVHPDRWANSEHPEARSENERSFKLLNEYLDAAKVIHIKNIFSDCVVEHNPTSYLLILCGL